MITMKNDFSKRQCFIACRKTSRFNSLLRVTCTLYIYTLLGLLYDLQYWEKRRKHFFHEKNVKTFSWPISHNDIGFNYSKRNFISGIKDLDLSSQGKSFETFTLLSDL